MIRLTCFVPILVLLYGCQKASGNANAPSTEPPSPVLVSSRSPARAPANSVELLLNAETPTVAIGQPIRLRLVIANRTNVAVPFDDGSLTTYATVRDAKGVEIAQWPFEDHMLAPPGREALWTIQPGASEPRNVVLSFRKDAWTGFGIPGDTYRGYAIEAHYETGSAIHAVTALPTTVSIRFHWQAALETVRMRADTLGWTPGWSGELVSNAVEVRLVHAEP